MGNTGRKMNIKYIIRTFIFLLLFLTSCQLLQDNRPLPQNYSSQTNTTINQTQINQTNATANITIEPPKPILLPVNDKLAVYVIDTSKKGATIITLNNKSMLINAQGGSDGLRILKTIKNIGIVNIDLFIVTNDNTDNIDGVVPILLRVPPKELIHSGIGSSNPYYKQYTSIFPNATILPFDKIIGLDTAVVHLIVPYDDELPTLLGEESSVVVKLIYGDNKFLFATDCGIDCETRISNINADVVVSNGGCNSLNYGFLKEVNPQLVVFSGTPCEETLERVKSLDMKYLATSADGDVIITSDGINYEYKSLKTR